MISHSGLRRFTNNCEPAGFTIADALDYGDWLFRTTDADGMRFDDVKGTWAPFVSEFMRSRTMAIKFAYSEYFDGNPNNLNWWATSPPMNSRSLLEDFTLHFALQAACDGDNAQVLNGAGFTALNPFLSCTFVDNPDTDSSFGEGITSSKLLAYAFILSIEGYPFVFAKDYFPTSVFNIPNTAWTGCYGLKPWIDDLIWIHENLAAGGTVTQYLDQKVIVVNRTGGPGLLTALNFDTWNQRTITCSTSFGSNVQLHDYTGRHPDIWTDSDGQATFTIPSNAYQGGQSYLCFSRAGFGQAFPLIKRSTTQVFFGAADLDILPALNGQVEVGQIWCADGSGIDLSFKPDVSGNTVNPQAQIALEVLSPAGNMIGSQKWTKQGLAPAGDLQLHAVGNGWHTVRLTSANLPAEGIPFELTVTYIATEEIAV